MSPLSPGDEALVLGSANLLGLVPPREVATLVHYFSAGVLHMLQVRTRLYYVCGRNTHAPIVKVPCDDAGSAISISIMLLTVHQVTRCLTGCITPFFLWQSCPIPLQ